MIFVGSQLVLNLIVINMVVKVLLVFPMEVKKLPLNPGTPARQRLCGAGSVKNTKHTITTANMEAPTLVRIGFVGMVNGGKKNVKKK